VSRDVARLSSASRLLQYSDHFSLEGFMKAVWAIATVLVTCVLALAANIDRTTAAGAPVTSKLPSCETAEYRQFDFFVGDWDAYDFGVPDSVIARNIVTPMLGGCAIR